MKREPPTAEQIIQRFYAKVGKAEPDECWLWLGAKEVLGYGKLCVQRTPQKTVKAHRLSYEVHYGAFDKSLSVCHTCDNPTCVNPRHLFLGTPADNSKDMVSKGRSPSNKGERNARAKITWAQRDEIERLVKSGKSQTEVARIFGIAQPNVSQIILGRHWRK